MIENTMRDYYAQRANTLEQIYQRPERQQDLLDMQQRIADLLKNHRVIEAACVPVTGQKNMPHLLSLYMRPT